MINKKNSSLLNKSSEENPRYIRILYLKQVSKPKYIEQQQPQSLHDKKSIAYLSSLIQDQKKGKIKELYQHTEQYPQQPNFAEKQYHQIIRYQNKKNKSLSFYAHSNSKKNKDQSLAHILDGQLQRKSRIILKKSRKYEQKIPKNEIRIDQSRKYQLQNSFYNFCKMLRPKQDESLGRKVLQRSRNYKQSEQKRIIPKKLQSVNNKIQRLKQDKQRSEQMITIEKQKSQQIFSKRIQKLQKLNQRKSIIHRKNFKEIQNFNWKKICDSDFAI